MESRIFDLIYESAFISERWETVLDHMAGIIDAPGGALLVAGSEVKCWTASSSTRERTAEYVQNNWLKRGQIARRLIGARHAGFLADHEIFSAEEMAEEPVYREFWRPRGLWWSTGTVIAVAEGEHAIVALTRRFELGPIERNCIAQLDELRPHLARSTLISSQLNLERAQAIGQALAAIGMPAFVINDKGKVLCVNGLIEALPDLVHWRAGDRLSFKDRIADKMLAEAIENIDRDGASVRSFPLRGAESGQSIVHVVPIRRSARDIFVRCSAAVVVTSVALPNAPPIELVQALFDLTSAEARVARSLASGKTVDDISLDGGVSSNTVRTHVRRVLEKTGCSRQTDVVALLTSIGARAM